MSAADTLSAKALKALAPGNRAQAGGIIAEKLADGDVRWSLNVMVDGQRIHRVIGRASEQVTLTQVKEALSTLRTRAREGRLNLPQGRKLHLSFAEAAEDYLKRMGETGGRDLGNKTRHLRQQLVPFLASDRLDQITEFRLLQYRKHRARGGASAATINRELATLSHLMNRASSKAWGWIKAEAKPPIPKEREKRKQIKILTVEQSQRLIAAAEADHDNRAKLFVLFGLNAAMRHSEIVARRWSEVDFDHCRIWIDKAKAGEREQPITPALRDALRAERELSKSDEYIFPPTRSDTKHPHRGDMRGTFARCVKAAGLDPKQCTPHVLRHSAITRLVKAGVDIPTIQKVSGHKTAAMVLHYTHVHGNHIDAAISVLDQGPAEAIAQEMHTAAGNDNTAAA